MMDRLLQDALNVQKLVPWLESDEDVINFMRRIPLERNYLRNKLTVLHFFKDKDGANVTEDEFNQGIEDDAREIVISFPDLPYHEIKKRLTIFGTMVNRKEAVLRQLLYENEELNNILNNLDNQPIRKRTSNSESNIKIKIRKVDGTLEVVRPNSLQELLQPTLVSSPSSEPTTHTVVQLANNLIQDSTDLPNLDNRFNGFNKTSTSGATTTIVTSQINDLQPTSSTLPTVQSTISVGTDSADTLEYSLDEFNNTSTSGATTSFLSLESPQVNDFQPTSSTLSPQPIMQRHKETLKEVNYCVDLIKEDANATSTITILDSPSPNNNNRWVRFDKPSTSRATSTIVSSQVNDIQPTSSTLTTLPSKITDRKLIDSKNPTNPFNSLNGFNNNNASTSKANSTIVSSQLNDGHPTCSTLPTNGTYRSIIGVYGGKVPNAPCTIVRNTSKTVIQPTREINRQQPNPVSSTSNNLNSHQAVSNLIKQLKEVTQASEDEITKAWDELGIPNCREYDGNVLNMLVDKLINYDKKETDSSDLSDTSTDEDYLYSTRWAPESDILSFGSSPVKKKKCVEVKMNFQDLNLSRHSKHEISSDSDDFEYDGAQPKITEERYLPPVDLSKSTNPGNSKNNVDTLLAQPEQPVIEIETTPSNESVNKPKDVVVDQQFVLKLIELFPQACPDYLRSLSAGKTWNSFNEIIEIIISDPNHPKRPQKPPSPMKEIDPEEQYEIVKALLPDADPTYLRMQCETLEYDPTRLNVFVNEANETKNYPTLKEYLRKQQLSAQSKQYTEEFNVEKFVELFPEPEKTFNDPNRKTDVDKWSRHYIQHFFEKKFDRIHKKTISSVLAESNYKIMSTDRTLMLMLETAPLMRNRRKHNPELECPQNILVLQELAYLEHRNDIEHFIKEKRKNDEADRQHAKENDLMNSCQCCYDDEVMPKDTFYCPKEHKFCRDCVKKSCEVALGEGKTTFNCLSACDEEFQLQCLQQALPPKMFSKLAQKKALAEIKAAGLEELETCPFCDFASIPNENDKIFRCLNPECMKESCRKCKEPNHIPLSCDEVERDEEVKARTYVENKMTEALLRKCYKCGTSFFKEEGCNKMTCTCGASMCYICKLPVKDYSHFNGIGGDKFHLCPLYSDTNTLNQQNVLGAAATAKSEVDSSKLKIDPSTDITNHYEQRKKKLPQEPHLALIRNQNNMQFGMAMRPLLRPAHLHLQQLQIPGRQRAAPRHAHPHAHPHAHHRNL